MKLSSVSLSLFFLSRHPFLPNRILPMLLKITSGLRRVRTTASFARETARAVRHVDRVEPAWLYRVTHVEHNLRFRVCPTWHRLVLLARHVEGSLLSVSQYQRFLDNITTQFIGIIHFGESGVAESTYTYTYNATLFTISFTGKRVKFN